jgi:hypothetical protein
MTEFEYLAIGVSLILGLGTTLLLTSFLAVFVNRKKVRVDWIPLVWAFYILLIQVQYYSAIWNLNKITEWTPIIFATPLLLASLIFLAAGLVLPSAHGDYPSDLGAYFQENGKWAIAALVTRGVVAIFANLFSLGTVRAWSPVEGLIALQIAMALFFIFSKKRALQVTATLLYGLVFLATVAAIYA